MGFSFGETARIEKVLPGTIALTRVAFLVKKAMKKEGSQRGKKREGKKKDQD